MRFRRHDNGKQINRRKNSVFSACMLTFVEEGVVIVDDFPFRVFIFAAVSTPPSVTPRADGADLADSAAASASAFCCKYTTYTRSEMPGGDSSESLGVFTFSPPLHRVAAALFTATTCTTTILHVSLGGKEEEEEEDELTA